MLEQRLLALKTEHGLDFDLVKITDLNEIMMTPGPIINGELKSVRTVPGDSRLLQWLKEQDNESQ